MLGAQLQPQVRDGFFANQITETGDSNWIEEEKGPA